MAEFVELERQDGVRMAWNVVPGTKQEASNCVVPVSAIYTPIKPFSNMPILPYAPLRCRNCRSVLNPFSIVDFAAKIWICPFCFQRNNFPPHYASISDENLPAELFPQCTTIEYEFPTEASSLPPVFLFVVDTSIIEEEMAFLKSALSQAVGLLPDSSLVGLITFGTFVHVHELGFSTIPKTYVFKGSKDVSKDQLLEQSLPPVSLLVPERACLWRALHDSCYLPLTASLPPIQYWRSSKKILGPFPLINEPAGAQALP